MRELTHPLLTREAGASRAATRDGPAVLLDWLSRCKSGGLHVLTSRTGRYVPWSQVLEDVQVVAGHLAAAGLRAGMRVGVRADNSYEWVVLDLATASVDAVAVAFPVADFKGESNGDLARRYGLSAIYAAADACGGDEPSFVARLDDLLEPHALCLRDAGAPVGVGPGDGAFTLAFSSGTAGSLKCLAIRWTGCLRLLEAQEEAYAVHRSDRILVALPLATFQQRYLTYLAIRSDCSVILSTTAQLLRALREGKPTLMLGPPSFYEIAQTRFANLPRARRRLLEAAGAATAAVPVAALRRRLQRAAFSSVDRLYGGAIRLMLVGSAPVQTSTLSFFRRAGLPLYEIYGMTEIGFVAWNTPRANRIGSVGKPVYPGTVSLGEDAEVLVRHPWHLCRGYEGPSRHAAAGVFRGDNVVATGDLGEFDADGFLYLRGRKKNLLISRGGLKVQLEELESSLCGAAGINHVAVFEPEGASGLAMAAWYHGDAAAARATLEQHAHRVNAGLPLGLQIRSAALLRGSLAAGSPLLNRNLKLDRDAVRRAVDGQLTPLTVPGSAGVSSPSP